MKCPKCGSENVQMQAKEYKPKTTGACCLIAVGIGCMILGIPGAIIGAVIGVIAGAILNSLMSNAYRSVMVCQDCGHVTQHTN